MLHKENTIYVLILLSFVFVFLMPPVIPLIHPDSAGYLNFHEYRSSFYPIFLDVFTYFGFSLENITTIQTLFFVMSLSYLLHSLLNVCKKKIFIVIYVVLLVGNVWVMSYHKAILTESLYITLLMSAFAALINFLHRRSTSDLFLFSLILGVTIAMRPSSMIFIVLLPIIVLIEYNKSRVFEWTLVATLIFPIVFTQLVEGAMYRLYHGDIDRPSIMSVIAFGKGAMMQGEFEFTGPNKDTLKDMSDEVDNEFSDVPLFVENIPYFWLKSQSLPNYEIYAQFNLLRDKRDYYAAKSNTTKENIMIEFGKQRILQSLDQWLINSLYYYAGSWGVRSTSFPYFISEYNNWASNENYIPLNETITYLPLKGDLDSSTISMVVFPGLLISGVVSGVVAVIFLFMLLFGKNMSLPFVLSGIFSVSVHSSLIFYSFINVATPRYTMSQFPILLLAFVFLALWVALKMKKST